MADQIVYIDRETGEKITEQTPGGGFLRFLYHNPFGKLPLHLMFKRKFMTALMGRYMNSKASRRRIDKFIAKYKMDLSEYVVPEGGYQTFNDFFYRKVKPEARPIGEGLVSPADGKVVAFESVKAHTKFFIKGSEFDLKTYFQDAELAKQFQEGPMLIVRLAPLDYHRYHFPATGKAGPTLPINGHFYSVSPIALKNTLEVFLMNKRTLCLLETEEFGKIVVTEVAATMVGAMEQTYQPGMVKKGDEKGFFAFGGSTVVLNFEPGRVQLDKDLIENSAKGIEMQVKMGSTIGKSTS